jgi:hypothetical protein
MSMIGHFEFNHPQELHESVPQGRMAVLQWIYYA